MKKFMLAVAIVTCLIFSVSNVALAEVVGNVNFLIGSKSLKKADWEPAEDQAAFGVLFDIRDSGWPVSIAVSAVGSGSSENYYDYFDSEYYDIDAATFELNLGVKKTWDVRSFHPFVGGGLSFASAQFDMTQWDWGMRKVTGEGDDVGFWVSVGGFWSFKRFNVGFNITRSEVEATMTFKPDNYFSNVPPRSVDVEIGGTTAGMLFGFNF